MENVDSLDKISLLIREDQKTHSPINQFRYGINSQADRTLGGPKSSSGFSLVSILVAMAITGILSLAVTQTVMSSSYASTSAQANYEVLLTLQEIRFILKDTTHCSLNLGSARNDQTHELPFITFKSGPLTKRSFTTPMQNLGYELTKIEIEPAQVIGTTPLNALNWSGLTYLRLSLSVTTVNGSRLAVRRRIPLYVEASNGVYTRCSAEALPPIVSSSMPSGSVGRHGQPNVLAFGCPSGQYLVGLKAKVSDVVYALGGICEDAGHITRTYLPLAGDINNGSDGDFVCPGGGFVSGFAANEVGKIWTGGQKVIRGMTLYCDGGSGAVIFGGGGSTSRLCPAGLMRSSQFYVTIREAGFADPISSFELLCGK